MILLLIIILFTQMRSITSFATSVNRLQTGQKVILYDGVCNFCNTWVDLMLRIDVKNKFYFSPLQGTTGKELLTSVGKDKDDISSVLLITAENECYEKSDCVLKVVSELGLPAKLASETATALLPLEFRNSIYDMVAENRYNLMGKRLIRTTDPEYSDRFI